MESKMSEILWKIPVPATALINDPMFSQLPKHQCSLSFEIEDEENEGIELITLLFDGVEAFRCTYLAGLTMEMVNTAYGKLVNLYKTDWLQQIQQTSNERGRPFQELMHMMICFDDGPCYEFICRNFHKI
jgi:hypothetical protein